MIMGRFWDKFLDKLLLFFQNSIFVPVSSVSSLHLLFCMIVKDRIVDPVLYVFD